MTTLAEKIEKKDFKEFVEAVNKLASHPKEISDEKLNESWEALKQFRELVGKEIKELMEKGQTFLDHGPKVQYPYIEILRANPLIAYCCYCPAMSMPARRKEWFYYMKEEDLQKELASLELFSRIRHFVRGVRCGDDIDTAAAGFVVYPELKASCYDLLVKLIDQEMFVSLYGYLQRIQSPWPDLNDPKLAEEQRKEATKEREKLYKEQEKWNAELASMGIKGIEFPEINAVDVLKLDDEVQRIFKVEMQRIALTTYSPTSELVMAAQSINFDLFSWWSNLSNSKMKVLLPLEEKKLILTLIKNLKLNSEEFPLGRVHAAKHLHFLLDKGLSLPETTATEDPWYAVLPWEDFRDYLTFLFEHIEKQKVEIVKFWKENHPNLILHHLMKGNFFIAEQMADLGLEIPKMPLNEFLERSVRTGLSNSKEIRKYHAILLLMQEKGIIDKDKVKQLLPKLIDPDRTAEIQKLVLEKLSLLLKKFIENQDEQLEISRETFKRISDLMLSFERDYALALSTIYRRPVVPSANGWAYRGVRLPETQSNQKLTTSYFTYGHRASFYAFLGHGYNTTVFASLEDGPQMSWVGCSDTTRISAQKTVSSAYSGHLQRTQGVLITMRYSSGDPIFFGNLHHTLGEVPKEMEVPICFPSTLFKVEITDSNNIVTIDRTGSKSKPYVYVPIAVVNNSSTTASCVDNVAESAANTEDNSQLIKDVDETCKNRRPFKEYVDTYSVDNLMERWSHHHATFSSMAARLRMVDKTLSDLSFLTPCRLGVIEFLAPGFQLNLFPKAICFDYGNKPSEEDSSIVLERQRVGLIADVAPK